MPVHGPNVDARSLPVLARVVESPLTSVAWLASLTAHPIIVEKLGGLEGRLAGHCVRLIVNLQNEAAGIDIPEHDRLQPSTARANRVHTLGEIFTQYPDAANYVVDGIVALTADAYLSANPGSDASELAGLEEDLNHLALRHGLPSHWAALEQRRGRFYLHLDSVTPLAAGPQVFWDVALSQVMLDALGLPAEPASVAAAVGLLQAHAKFKHLFTPYVREGSRRYEAMIAGRSN